MTKCIGLTGRAGSGKSTVAHFFQALGVPVIDADKINHQLLHPGEPGYQAIKAKFGKEVLLPDQQLNKRLLRQWLIQDPAIKTWLEKLLHPLVRARIQRAVQTYSNYPYCIIEIPLLIARNDYPYLDQMVYVDSTPETQLKRLMQRDHLSEVEAQALIDLQAARANYIKISDEVILNDGTIAALEHAVKKLHEKYRN